MKNKDVQFFKGNITQSKVDVIVNAANKSLAGGGGVDGAIHAAAGPELVIAAVKFAPCKTGHAVITPGFKLPAKYIIHAVGPVWKGGDNDERALLKQTYQACFELAKSMECKTIALPAISCGAYGFPIKLAVGIALETSRQYLNDFEEISFPCFDGAVLHAFEQATKEK